MTITQLSYFTHVVEAHSLTKVAEQLHVSQPAVSSAIRDLEKEFSVQLFYRTHRELTLTADGAEFYEKAVGLLRHYQTFQQEMRERNSVPHCSLAMTNNFAPVYLPGLYRYLRAHMPGVTLDLQEVSVAEMFRMVKNGLLDAACLGHEFTPTEEREFHRQRVGTFSIKLCIHQKLAYFEGEYITAEQLGNIPLALYHHGGTLRAKICGEFKRYNLEPNILFAVNQVRTIEELVKQGLAVGFLPEKLAKTLPGVKLYDFYGLQEIPAYLIWKKESPQVDQLVRHVGAYFRMAKHDEVSATQK